MSIKADVLRVFLNAKQKEKDSVQDYTRRFKTNKDIMESHLGHPLIITKYIKQTKEYKKKEIKVDKRNKQLIIPQSISPFQEEWSKKVQIDYMHSYIWRMQIKNTEVY